MLRESRKIAVIADDLTGANDTGVQFSKHGVPTIVVLEMDELDFAAEMADVIAISTDSRALTAESAYQSVKRAADVLRQKGISRVYKKIDSTLRGNIGAELDAVMDAFGASCAFVVPAFPGTGRITLNGKQLVDCIPVSESDTGSDILSPVRESHVPTLLAAQTSRRVGHAPIDWVRQGVHGLEQRLSALLQSGFEVIVIDAVTDDDLLCIARTLCALDSSAVIAGAGGLAATLPETLGMLDPARSALGCSNSSGVLTVVGSATPVAHEQVEYAVSTMGLEHIVISASSVLSGLDSDDSQIEVIVRDVVEPVREGRDVVISVSPPDSAGTATTCPADSRRIADFLGHICGAVLEATTVAGLVLTGGDTALSVCNHLGAVGISLADEVAPGVPCGCLVGGPHAGLRTVTKAGGFGQRETLAMCIGCLRSTRSRLKEVVPNV